MVVKLILFVRFLGELKIHTYQKDISKLTDLYKNPKIGLRLTKASKLSRSLTFLLFPDQPFHAAARNSGTSRIFFSEICAFYKNCDSHSQNTLALCFLGSKKKVSLCRRDSLLLWKSEGTFDRFFMTHEILQQIQNDMRNLLHSAKIGGITFLLTFHL